MLLVEDPHSAARPREALVTDLELALSVDFDSKVISGLATWKLQRSPTSSELWLDTRDLQIESVVLTGGSGGPRRAEFELGEDRDLLGRSLRIELDADADRVQVEYRTSPGAGAVQWLSASQTAGGEKPFLFTQSQAILARTWLPCQDTPGVRFTYRARVRVAAGLRALMSAGQIGEREVDGSTVEFEFEMPQAIPSYLMAVAVGDLEFRKISDRCGVWAEPGLVEKAAWEFADTEKMMLACEKLFGPYRWQRYDILVLPPSFPFGGMENPRLTFATPTILAGDRSLTALIAHELAHSWSGNLVTNATWDDFWLNEGFTVYLEHRIMEALYGKAYDEMLAKLGVDELRRTVAEMTEGPKARPADSHLKLDLAGRDPDDGMTDIAYEKGYLFLRTCEEIVGREPWDRFLRSYFEAHAFRSMTTEAFVAYMRESLIQGDVELEKRLLVDAWIFGPGIPSNASRIESDAFAKVEAEAKRFAEGADASALSAEEWSTHEWLHFLKSLPRGLPAERLANLDAIFRLTQSGNSEVICQWFLVTIPASYEPALGALERFLVRVGRRKFLEPLYTALAQTEEGRDFARRVYAKARPGYHVITSGTIDHILGKHDGPIAE